MSGCGVWMETGFAGTGRACTGMGVAYSEMGLAYAGTGMAVIGLRREYSGRCRLGNK